MYIKLDRMTIPKQLWSWTRQSWSPVDLYVMELRVLFRGRQIIKVQCWAKQSASPPVNLYIAEVWLLFLGHRLIEAQFSSHQAENLQSKKCLSMEWGIRILYFIKVYVYCTNFCLTSPTILYKLSDLIEFSNINI